VRYLILIFLVGCAMFEPNPWPHPKLLGMRMYSLHTQRVEFFEIWDYPTLTECFGTREAKRWCRMDNAEFETCWIDTYEFEPTARNKQQTRHNDVNCVYYYNNGGVRRNQ
jgi:hypothetical protein